MATIIKLPTNSSKGILSITNLEMTYSKNILEKIKKIKSRWIILYHPNYYDYNFYNNGIFDAFFAWNETFKVKDDDNAKILNLSCHNFIPSHFNRDNNEKYFDFIGLSKLMDSDGNPKQVLEFLDVVKKAMKIKKNLKGVLIISVPGIRPFRTNYIRNVYKKMFNKLERNNFEFITIDYDIPNALSTKTISMFYNKSKFHLNLHPKERHGRAQAYAIANQMPVVGYQNLTYLVEKKFRCKPFYFIAKDHNEFPERLIEAINYFDNDYKNIDFEELSQNFKSSSSILKLKNKLNQIFDFDDNGWNFKDDWDQRLAKHHYGYHSTNSYFQNLDEFITFISQINGNEPFDEDLQNEDFINKKGKIFFYLRNFNFQIKQLLRNLILMVRSKIRKIKY